MLKSSKRPPGPVLLAWTVAIILSLGLVAVLVYGVMSLASAL